MFGELLQTNEYNEKRAPNNGQPSKIAVLKTKKKGFEIALKALMVGATGLKPAA